MRGQKVNPGNVPNAERKTKALIVVRITTTANQIEFFL